MFSLILILAGSYFLWRNLGYARDETKLREYLETSPKAKLWVRSLGMEKSITLSKVIFLPLGLIVSAGMIAAGFIDAFLNLSR